MEHINITTTKATSKTEVFCIKADEFFDLLAIFTPEPSAPKSGFIFNTNLKISDVAINISNIPTTAPGDSRNAVKFILRNIPIPSGQCRL
jgi:hypothetical protein